MTEAFILKDCTLAVKATGEFVASIKELHDALKHVSTNSIYYHFWGERLRPSFVHPEYHNDFAKWAHFSLHDNILSERLGIIDPTEYNSIEELRSVLLDIIEERLDEVEYLVWSKKENKFFFLESNVIVFNGNVSVKHPSELKKIIPTLSPSAIFYHFIDARIRTPDSSDDFSTWLLSFGEEFSELISNIKHVDPYFRTLTEIRQKLTEIFNAAFAT